MRADLAPPAPAPTTPTAPATPGTRRAPDLWIILLGLLGCGVVLVWLESAIGVYQPDDAYITFRYAENLAAGQGLVFNAAAPPVEGYSNLSWILLLAGLARLHLDLPLWAAELGRALSLLNLVLVYALARTITGRRLGALAAPALLALTAPYALWARGGLETMWYTTLLVGSLWLLCLALGGRAWAWPGGALALFALALTRHDGAIPMGIGGLVVLVWLVRGGLRAPAAGGPRWRLGTALRAPGALAALLSFAGLTLAFLVYTWWRGEYFGQLVPTPFFSRLGGTLTNPAAWTHTLASYFTLGSHYSGFGDLLVPAFAGAAAGLILFHRADLRDWLVAGSAVGLSLLYFISESYNPGIRYMVPVLPLLYVYAILPLLALLAAAWRRTGPGGRRVVATGLVAAGVAVYLLVMAPRTADDGQRAEVAKLQSLVPLGQWLHTYAPPHASVALQDIGTVAYYSGLRVIDNNPGALTNGDLIYRAGSQGYADLTLGPHPEFLVFTSFSYINPVFYAEFAALQQDPRFLDGYTLYGKVKYWPDRCYWVYKRNDVQLPGAAQAAFPPSNW